MLNSKQLDTISRKTLLLLAEDLLACAIVVCETGDTVPLRELIDAWEATLEVLADKPLLMRRLRKATREGDYIPWEKVKRELEMGGR